MNRDNIIVLLNQYKDRYQLTYDYKFNRSAFSEAREAVESSGDLSLYYGAFGRVLNWVRQEYQDDYEAFRSRLFAEIDDPDLQKKILNAEYTDMLVRFVPDGLKLLTPENLATLVDRDKMGTGDVLIDLLLRRDYKDEAEVEMRFKPHDPRAMNPIIVKKIICRIPRMYELVYELKPLYNYSLYDPDSDTLKPCPNKPHPIKPQFPISNCDVGFCGNEFYQYFGRIHDLLEYKDIMAAACKNLIEEDTPGIWSKILAGFDEPNSTESIVEFYTKQAVAEHVFMQQAAMMQPQKEDALQNNAEIVQKKIRSSLNVARSIYLNYGYATNHLDVVATALTSTMTRGLTYYFDNQKIQDMNLIEAKDLIKEKQKLPREKDAEFALFLKSFRVKAPVLRLTNG